MSGSVSLPTPDGSRERKMSSRPLCRRRNGKGPRYLLESLGRATLLAHELQQLLGTGPQCKGDGGRGEGRAPVRYGTRRGTVHQRDVGTARGAGAPAGKVSQPPGRDAVQLGLCKRYGHSAAADHRTYRCHLRRAEPQLHHQCDRSFTAGGEAHLSPSGYGGARAPPGRGRSIVLASHYRDGWCLQHARRPRAARAHSSTY